MVVNVKNLSDILDDKLSLVERGILITILLLKDKEPKMTLAKAKTKISFLKNKKELINLHKLGLISWSGYNTAIESLKRKETTPVILDILNFMNGVYKRRFEPTEERNRLITTLLEKYTVLEIKLVISNRYVVWKDEPVMSKHLVPETIFRLSKFTKYLDEGKHTKEGESFVSAGEINLKHGDEITIEIANKFPDNDTITCMVSELNLKGEKITKGREITKYGKDLKRLLKVRNQQDFKDFVLTYIQK